MPLDTTSHPLLRRRPVPRTIVRPAAATAVLAAALIVGTAAPAGALPTEPDTTAAPESSTPAISTPGEDVWMLSDEPTELSGTQRSVTLDVAIPPGWQPTGPARLSFDYSVGSLTSGTLSVTVDGESIDVIEVVAPGESVEIEIPADRLAAGRHSIQLTTDLVLTVDDACRDQLHPERRLTLGADTALNVPLTPTGEIDIADFPAALEPLGTSERSIDVHLVGTLTEDLTEATTTVIEALREDVGDLDIDVVTNSRSGFSLDLLSPERPAIVLGTANDLGDASTGPGATLTQSPSGHAMLVLASSDASTLTEHADELAEQRSDASPVIDTEVFSLSDLGYDDRTLEGPDTDSTLYGFDLPINDIPERITINVDARRSSSADSVNGVGVIVNGQRVGSAPFDDAGRTVDIEIDADRTVLRPGRNLVRIDADFVAPGAGCSGTASPQSVDVIANSTSFERGDLSDEIDLDLEDLPFVFRDPSDSDNLTIVLPEQATDVEITQAVDVALLLGADGHPASIVRAADLDERRLFEDHLLILGELNRQPTFERLASGTDGEIRSGDLTGLPIAANSSATSGPGEIPDAIIRFIPTSVASDRLVMVITGSHSAGVGIALDALLDIDQRGELRGASVEFATTGDGEAAETTISTQSASISQSLRATAPVDSFETSTSSSSSSTSSSSTAPGTLALAESDDASGFSSPGTRIWVLAGLAIAIVGGVAVRYRKSQADDETPATTH